MTLLLTRSIILSVIVHAIAVAMLIFSLEFSPEPIQAVMPAGQIMDATTVDAKQVEQEVAQLKKLEQKNVTRVR